MVKVSIQDDDKIFFTTSTFRLSLLSICSLGFYQWYWFYKNWLYIKNNVDSDISPFWRTFFYPIWAYIIFNEIQKKAELLNYNKSLPTGIYGILYFSSYFLSHLPDPYWLVLFLSFLLIIPFNNAAIEINKELDPNFKNNINFTKWNWAIVVLGCIVWVVFFIDYFSPLDANNTI